jgi:hypothetical protein
VDAVSHVIKLATAGGACGVTAIAQADTVHRDCMSRGFKVQGKLTDGAPRLILDFKDARTAAPRRAPRRPHDSPPVHQSAGRTRNLGAGVRALDFDDDAPTRGIASPAGSLLGDAHLKQKTFKTKNELLVLI